MSATSYFDAAEFVLRQNFYRDNNVIIDRTGERKVIVPRADHVFKSVLNAINSETELWVKGDEEIFLERVSTILGLPSDLVINKVQQKLETLAKAVQKSEILIKAEQKLETLFEANASRVVEYITAMGVVFKLFRATVNKNLVKQITQQYPDVLPFQEKLEDSLAVAESFLANLAVLHRLATITETPISSEFLRAETSAVVKRVLYQSTLKK